MNTDRFQTISDGFDLLGLRAQFRWRTPGSICFHLCRHYPELRAWVEVGWLDVHYPLLDREEFDSKVFLRACFPQSIQQRMDYGQWSQQVRQALEIQDRGGTLMNLDFLPDREIDMVHLGAVLDELRARPELADRRNNEVTVYGAGAERNIFPGGCKFH